MRTRGWQGGLAVMMVAALGLAGCAAQSGAGASGAGGANGSASPTMAAADGSSAASVYGSSGRIPPHEYVAAAKITAGLNDIHFDFDKADIRPEAARMLDAGADWLKKNPGHLLLIEGHADERGTNEYNLALGDKRAKNTMNYLVSLGVAARRITVVSYGEEKPVCKARSEACWAENRRAHFGLKAE